LRISALGFVEDRRRGERVQEKTGRVREEGRGVIDSYVGYTIGGEKRPGRGSRSVKEGCGASRLTFGEKRVTHQKKSQRKKRKKEAAE